MLPLGVDFTGETAAQIRHCRILIVRLPDIILETPYNPYFTSCPPVAETMFIYLQPRPEAGGHFPIRPNNATCKRTFPSQ